MMRHQSENMAVLQTQKLTMQFGGLKAVSGLDLTIPKGMIFGLIGPNGAGKTTVFNLLTGVYQPTEGGFSLFGKPIKGLRPFEINHCGVARTFQNIRLFKALTVLENIMIAMDSNPSRKHFGILPSVLRTSAFIQNEREQEAKAIELLKIFNLETRKEDMAKNLPYGDQRRLEIARAMATGAKFLLLDEPAAGMNSTETASLMNTIQLIRDQYDMTILLIEHDMKLVMRVCERIAVLDYGIKIAEGSPTEIQSNLQVIEAYLGKAATHAS